MIGSGSSLIFRWSRASATRVATFELVYCMCQLGGHIIVGPKNHLIFGGTLVPLLQYKVWDNLQKKRNTSRFKSDMNESGEPRAGVRQLLKRIQLLCSAPVCSGTSGKNAPGKLYFHLNIALMRIEKIRYLEGRVEKLVQESVLARVPIEHVDGYASVQSVHLIWHMYKVRRPEYEANIIIL